MRWRIEFVGIWIQIAVCCLVDSGEREWWSIESRRLLSQWVNLMCFVSNRKVSKYFILFHSHPHRFDCFVKAFHFHTAHQNLIDRQFTMTFDTKCIQKKTKNTHDWSPNASFLLFWLFNRTPKLRGKCVWQNVRSISIPSGVLNTYTNAIKVKREWNKRAEKKL